jgi:para-nitrobenzyl esterase
MATASVAAQQPVVHTASGDLSGVRSSDGKVISFRGIPFAAPPVGNLRWAPPATVQRWTGVRPAAAFGASCMQREHGDALPWTMDFLDKNQISEDCLYLNVWTPIVSAPAKLPVVVYIHGGSFTEGSGAVPIFDGTHLAETGMVIVTINYRLGVFGFFAHPELTAESPHHSSGNYGLMDQIAALAWVQENIANFGGDPQRVTIWGQSAGAMSVGDMLNSPLGVGLFQRAMADSGIDINSHIGKSLKTAEDQGTAFATLQHAASLKDLRALPTAALLAAQQTAPMHFGPIADGWVMSSTQKAASLVSVITGYQANDDLLGAPQFTSASDYTAWVEKEFKQHAAEFEKVYPAHTAEEANRMMAEATRDGNRVAMFLWASQHELDTGRPVFTYYFDRAIPWPQHPEFGAFHSGELPYFFLNLSLMDRPWTAADHRLSRECAAYLKSFAESGNPNGATNANAPTTGLPAWDGVHAETPSTMELGVHLGPMPLAEKPRLDFWTSYFNAIAPKNM